MFSILFITRRRKYSEWPCVSILVLVDVPFCCIKKELLITEHILWNWSIHCFKIIMILIKVFCQTSFVSMLFVRLNYYVINLFHQKIFFFCFHQLNTISRKKNPQKQNKQNNPEHTNTKIRTCCLSIHLPHIHPSIYPSIFLFYAFIIIKKMIIYNAHSSKVVVLNL